MCVCARLRHLALFGIIVLVLEIGWRPQVCLVATQQKEAHAPTSLFCFGEGQKNYGGNMPVGLDMRFSGAAASHEHRGGTLDLDPAGRSGKTSAASMHIYACNAGLA